MACIIPLYTELYSIERGNVRVLLIFTYFIIDRFSHWQILDIDQINDYQLESMSNAMVSSYQLLISRLSAACK